MRKSRQQNGRRAQASNNGIPFICSNEGVWEPQQDFVCAEAQPVDHTESDFSPAVTTGTFTGAGPGEGLDFSGASAASSALST